MAKFYRPIAEHDGATFKLKWPSFPVRAGIGRLFMRPGVNAPDDGEEISEEDVLAQCEDIEGLVEACVEHVQSWEGVEDDDGPTECTDENKRLYFGQNTGALGPVLMPLISTSKSREAREKASGDGSASSSSTPESDADPTKTPALEDPTDAKS